MNKLVKTLDLDEAYHFEDTDLAEWAIARWESAGQGIAWIDNLNKERHILVRAGKGWLTFSTKV